MDIFSSTTVPIVEQVLNFSQARHAVLASNVANMDVPGYETRDLSVNEFQERLAELIDVRDRQLASRASDSASPDGLPSLGGLPRSESEVFDPRERAMRRVKDSMQSIMRHDGNNVPLEAQVLELSKNQSMHNMAIAILNHQFRLLNVAISERV
ncbi:MAG: flagellar basal body rod protein FlgB [Planctomycetales bacterium]|nr:flagellar basal body rod protein FlgB [Planctomycetales bacterium]